MSSCLYECLCEARLEQYYTHFTAMGFLKSQELVKLTMNDYSLLGVRNMHDQKRLFQLIQIIKAVQEEERDHSANMEHTQADSLNLFVEKVKPGPRRHLDFDSLSGINGASYSSGYPKLSSCANQQKNTASGLLKSPLPVDQLSTRVCLKDTQSLPGRETGHPTIFLPNNARDCSTDEIQNARMILHISGYNYGLPHAAIRHTNHVKEQTWTEIEKIHVCVRKRPLRVREVRRGEVDIAKVEEGKSILVCEKKEAVDLTHYLQQHVFYFDEVFEEACTNHDVYLKTAYPLIQHVFSGGKATCFAYGQTGAGKTHTMIGTYRNPGLYALAAEDIFIHLETSEPGRALFTWISFYEIYCGQLYDLLNGRKRLFAREDGNHVVQIVGLREIRVEGVQSLLEVISWGSKARSTGASGINTDSSRSHAVIQIQLKDPAETIVGRISFIDLAGSERAADARDSDKQAKLEGAEINQSLLALKECIRALDQEHAHTPFRQSKLTLVLKDSFIGNSKTCMIANISPSHMATEHTLNTLRYADRVKEIKRGSKASSTIFSRCQGGRSPSPKQAKTCGDKSVPKKVKPRIEQSHYSDKNAMQPKLSSAVLHPPNALLCSTPRISDKNVCSPATSKLMWQSHSTPLKGMFKKNSSDVSNNTKDERLAEKGIVSKEAFLNNPKSGTSRRMQCGQRNYLGTNRNVKVQAVHPIQKEVIPRNGLHFTGQVKNYSPNKENNTKNFESEYQKRPKSPENELFLQKEREKHLRLYHQQLQQLQQPPLLQKKLTYQPLKELLSQFYQHKIEMSNEENEYTSSVESTVQKSDVQIECSSSCDTYSDCQSMNDRQNHTCNQNSFYEIEGAKESGGNNVQVFCRFQDQSCNPRIEDNSVCGSQWSTEEECAVQCSSGDNATEMLCNQNNIDVGQMKPRYLSFDSKNSLQNFSTDHQGDNFPISKISQMDSSFLVAADLKSMNTGATASFQSSRNIDFHLNSVIEVAKDEQACNSTSSIIPSTDCISEDLMNVFDHHSVERPLSQNTDPADQGMTISCNQRFAEMEELPTNSDILSAQTNHFENWMTPTHNCLDKNQNIFSDPILNLKNASHDQHLILNDGIEMQIVAKDENDHCSNINHVETTDKDINILATSLPDMSTNDCTGFLIPPKHDLGQEESLGALLCGSLSSKDISQTSKCHNYKQAIKCFRSELYDADAEESVINSSILHLHHGVASTIEAVTNKYFSDAGNQTFTDLHLNQVSRQEGISTPVIASSKTTEPINSSEIKESQEETEVLVAGSCTEEMLDNHHNKDGFQPCVKSIDKGLIDMIKEKLLQNTSVPFNHFNTEDNSIPIEVFVNQNKNNNEACGLQADGSQSKHLIAQQLEAMEKAKKLVVQAHCEQLEEMLALFEKEECLLNKLTILDFDDYVTQLEDILMLKAKSIQRLQGEIHKYQIYPETK
ncbi:kinesin-like protein KIF24 [Pristis pectinata]|uniref:kinesin-like protein KIF24 n=1 Tax=Pristis pectinata TaxID=685728 RepID=UPI00223D4136|nr:kinesin-like protein KIF24 [Pristis pectinata]